MEKTKNLLFVFQPDNADCSAFVSSLKSAMSDCVIHDSKPKLLLDAGKYRAALLFLPASSKSLRYMRHKGRVIQVITSPPNKPEDYRKCLIGDHIVVFSEHEKSIVERFSKAPVSAIPPCVDLPDILALKPASEIREGYGVGNNLFVVCLSNPSTEVEFKAHLYVIREYHRRGGFRFVMPVLKNDKDALRWRKELQQSVQKERLTSATLAEIPDVLSTIDSADITLFMSTIRDPHFDFPLLPYQALIMGRIVFAYNRPPFNEVLHRVEPRWICRNNEDFIRESKDLRKEIRLIDELSTEAARRARNVFGKESIASQYRNLYDLVLQ